VWLGPLAAILALAVDIGARADEPAALPTTSAAVELHEIDAAREEPSLAATVGWIGAGFVSAFFAHEMGHVVANLALGNVPHFTYVTVDGFFPFLAIEPHLSCKGDVCVKEDGTPFGAGRHGRFAIVSAGFEVQHLTDELILQLHPNLRDEDRPFMKGMLAFNTLVSALYAVAALTGAEGDNGDLGGEAMSSHLPKSVLAALLLVPAGLDIYRYLRPTSSWAPWASMGCKAGYVGLTFTF
jgi:hypothetical protein